MKVQNNFTEKVQDKFRSHEFHESSQRRLVPMSSMKVQNNFTEKVQNKFRFIIFPEVQNKLDVP